MQNIEGVYIFDNVLCRGIEFNNKLLSCYVHVQMSKVGSRVVALLALASMRYSVISLLPLSNSHEYGSTLYDTAELVCEEDNGL